MNKKISILFLIILILGILIYIFKVNIFVDNIIKEIITSSGKVLSKNVNIVLDKDFSKTSMEEKERDIKELKEILDLNITSSNYNFINATIIDRDSILWFSKVTIDKGRFSGVKKGMGVINNKALIGEIVKVTNNTSEIELITSPSFNKKISVLINNEYGVTSKYDLNKNVLLVDGISDLKKVKIGDKVTTSGLTSLYPSGIIIGQVKGIRKDKYNIEKYVEVELSGNIKTTHYVSVLKK